MNSRNGVIAIVITGAVLAGTAPACAHSERELTETTTYFDLPLEQKVRVEKNGRVLMVPAGYFANWWQLRHLDSFERKEVKIGIHFWMPTKKYPQFSGTSVVDRRPRYEGEIFDPASYVVNSAIEFRKLDDPDYIPPLKRAENEMNSPRWDFPRYKKPWRMQALSFGVERMLLEGKPERANEFYRSLPGQEPQAFFKCHSPIGRPWNSFCTGYVHFTGDGLGVYIEIPEDFLPQWRAAATSLRDLVRSWQVPQSLPQ